MVFKKITQAFLFAFSLSLVCQVFSMDTLHDVDKKIVFLDEQVKSLSQKLIDLSQAEKEQLLQIIFHRVGAMKQIFFESFLGVLSDDFAGFTKQKKSCDTMMEIRRIFNDRIVERYQQAEAFYSESTEKVQDVIDVLENCAINIQMNKYPIGDDIFTFSKLKKIFIIKTFRKNFPAFYKEYLGRSESINNLFLLQKTCLTYFPSSVYKFCLKDFYEKMYATLDKSKIDGILPETIFSLDCSTSLFALLCHHNSLETQRLIKKVAHFFQLVRLCRIQSLLCRDIESEIKAESSSLKKKFLMGRKKDLSFSLHIDDQIVSPSVETCIQLIPKIFQDQPTNFLDDIREVLLLEYDFDTQKTLLDSWGKDLQYVIESFSEKTDSFQLDSRNKNKYRRHGRDVKSCGDFVKSITDLIHELVPTQSSMSAPSLAHVEEKVAPSRRKKKKKKKKSEKASKSEISSSVDKKDEIEESSSSSDKKEAIEKALVEDIKSLAIVDGDDQFIKANQNTSQDISEVFKLCDHAEICSYDESAFGESCVDACCFQDKVFASILDVSRGSRGGRQCLACVYAPDKSQMCGNQLIDLDYSELQKISRLMDNNHAFTKLVEKSFGQWAVLVEEVAVLPSSLHYARGYRVACTYHLAGRLGALGYSVDRAKNKGSTGSFEFVVLKKSADDSHGLCVHRFFRKDDAC